MPNGNGPVAEFDYWHERQTAVSVLVEQLKKPKFLRICGILNKGRSDIFAGFQSFREDLQKFYSEARDNVKFLSVVLRHFKIVEFCTNFKKVEDCLESLMEGFHMIWILSKYYCIDETMVPLLERVAWCLCNKTTTALDNKVVFRYYN